jgi:TonB family protein
MTLAALVVAIGVVGVFAVIAVLTGAFEKQKASIPDQVLPPHGSCPILETLQVAIGNESGYSEYERYFCIDGTQHLSLLLHDGKLIPLTLEGWRNGWPDRGFVLPRGAFVLVTNGGLKLNSSEWSSFIAEHQTDQRITVIKALCKLKIPVLTDEGYANEDTFSGPEGSYQALKFGNACASLVKPTDELATSESRSPNVRRVPFVGCKSDGQGGPVEAPKGESKVVPIDPTAAQRIAYYATGKDFGVLAPRGWHCFGSYGSNGTNLYVSPQPINTNIEPSVFAGPVIELSLASGDTSGRFDVAKVIARVFPAHMAFVRRVIEGGEEPTSSFPLGPYPNDKLNYRSSEIVEYQTPARTGGLGTVSLLQSNADPISGVAILTGQDPDLLQLSVRLSPEQVDLAPTIIQQVERDVAGQPQSLTSTPPRTPWVITLNGVSALPGHQPASAGVGTDSGLQTVGEGVSAPVPLNSVEATYSDEARRAKVQGVCLVSVNVDTQGNPQNPRVVRSLGKGLDENAIEAVKRYRFKPAMKGGRTPVPVRITVEVRFSLY